MRVYVAVWLAGIAWLTGSSAFAATCKVVDMQVLVTNFGFHPSLPPLVGYEIPVEVTEGSGNFRFDLTALPVATFIIAGTDSDLQPAAEAYFGTLDAAGNLSLADAVVKFITLVGAPGEFTTETPPFTLATGIAVNTVQLRDYPTVGASLDFSTGRLTLAGAGVIPDAPMAGIPVVAGLQVTCTLDPIPNPSNLPPGLSLKAKLVKGRFGKAKKNATGVVGDTIMLKGTLAQGSPPVDPATHDLFVRIAGLDGAESAFLLARVPANTLQAKGKTLSATDTDGTAIRIVEGQKQIANEVAPVGGKLVLRTTKKGVAFTYKQTGLDLCDVPDTSTVTVSLGTASATSAVSVKRGGKSTCP